MNKVYVSSPFRGDEDGNVAKARWYARYVADEGYLPVVPHIYFTQFLRDHIPEERNKAMQMNRVLLLECSELWVFGNVISEGMKQEIEWAKAAGIPIRYFDERMVESAHG
ncbi:DUF4406 domain-containing protein [Anaerovibrio sp.]|uniref:DUF7768 domain-containing protein n=1 Tax=Anaerovibrio sp. TaxID=1872532 RepID=UPI0026166CDD|nr:DUF4406 domain-containing protein [Anaerovibrio sp.]MDD6597143.1 DUF4406 domain-containing protein [Anaerovibrio sp.]